MGSDGPARVKNNPASFATFIPTKEIPNGVTDANFIIGVGGYKDDKVRLTRIKLCQTDDDDNAMPEPPTLSSAVLDSDEDDGDYVPEEQGSDSDSEAGPDTKRQRVEDVSDSKTVDVVTDDTTRNALWNSFLESTKTNVSNSHTPTLKTEVKMVTIEKKYRFAGEDVIEKVKVAEDSQEAQQWRSRQLPNQVISKPPVTQTPSSPNSGNSTPNTALSAGTQPPPATGATKSKVTAKPRKSLSGLAAAAKPKKLTTLDKSRLDWQSHLASATQEERDELERNRKAGGAGYLEKVDFLVRVGERRETALEDSKRKRR
ncbi:Bucentaur or craniofacial development protein [Ceratobasidium theobromae]|uniref:SWR1-complex protein 5 n=1 Tax=Ceratobasidium theobromae TaxID=1582974 RepID=A0A5N5QM73_9AGAM|nr:Bucentaur or craniofacial development protein [Ceratobasidium theobromae]